MACENMTKKFPNLFLVYGFLNQGALSLSIAVSKNLTTKINAQELIKKLIELIGGRGGGQPHLAQLNNIALDQKGNIKQNIMKLLS